MSEQTTIRTVSHRPADCYAAYMRTTRFGCLDGLRFISIAAVLWHHAPIWEAMTNPPRILERGFVGVDFFFVLSGYLITTLLLREEARDGQFSLLDFYWRRLLRIVPVYFFVVTLMGGYYVLVQGQAQYAELLPYYYLFLSNFLIGDIPNLAPTWSLAVEEQYYMIWPPLLLLLPRRMVLPVLAGLITVNVLGVMGAFAPLGIVPVTAGPLLLALPNATYAPILMGSAAALVLNTPAGYAALYRLCGPRFAALPAFGVLGVIIQVAPPDLRGLPNLAMHLAMTLCLITLVIREDNVLRPVLAWRPVVRVGEISYGIYLYHLIALHIVSAGMAAVGVSGVWGVLIVYSALSIAMAEISFNSLEAVFRRYRNRRPGRKNR